MAAVCGGLWWFVVVVVFCDYNTYPSPGSRPSASTLIWTRVWQKQIILAIDLKVLCVKNGGHIKREGSYKNKE